MRFAVLDEQVYQVNTWADYYKLVKELRRRGVCEVQLRHGTPEQYRELGIYVSAYINQEV